MPLWLALIAMVSLLSSMAMAQSAAIAHAIRSSSPQFSGTVLVTKGSQTIFHESFGLASRQFEVANSNSTKFKIASITKLFTSVITLQLYEEGKLSLQAPIATALPSCGGDVGGRVNVHQLLNHTSGLQDAEAVKSKEDAIRNGIDIYQRPYTPDELVAKYCGAPLTNPPGAIFKYNNGDYILLGKIIETVERAPFEDVLERRVLQPLKMADSGLHYQHRVVPRLAATYFTREEGSGVLANDLPVYDENWYAAGAMYSTAADLRDFAHALFGGRLLKPATMALLLQPGLDDYGYGVWVAAEPLGEKTFTTVQRPGRIMGANAMLYRVVDADLTVIVLSNTDTSNVDPLARAVSRVALQ